MEKYTLFYKIFSKMQFKKYLISYLPIIAALVSQGYVNVNAMYNPKLLYYTPRLWEMTGDEFWRHFLFETPFAVSRGFIWLAFPIVIGLYICFSIKAKILYYKQK